MTPPLVLKKLVNALDMEEQHFFSALWVFKEHVELAKQEKRDMLHQERMLQNTKLNLDFGSLHQNGELFTV